MDVYAPGVEIRSAMFYTTTANITATGTSMACPMVSGVSSLYAQANPAAQPDEVSSISYASVLVLGHLAIYLIYRYKMFAPAGLFCIVVSCIQTPSIPGQ